MAWKIVRRADGEVAVCGGCKGERWLTIVETNTYCKFICEKCLTSRTMYTDPNVWAKKESK